LGEIVTDEGISAGLFNSIVIPMLFTILILGIVVSVHAERKNNAKTIKDFFMAFPSLFYSILLKASAGEKQQSEREDSSL